MPTIAYRFGQLIIDKEARNTNPKIGVGNCVYQKPREKRVQSSAGPSMQPECKQHRVPRNDILDKNIVKSLVRTIYVPTLCIHVNQTIASIGISMVAVLNCKTVNHFTMPQCCQDRACMQNGSKRKIVRLEATSHHINKDVYSMVSKPIS
ncbi:hypothetical protein RJ639_027516 [Escallonia herrerae]|uniref:Uncharacterized protein n=1 Tax=Escallonia herrerae TaxID=1293975 RepID=A0AA89BPD4_9ASTE|nr:hypothetical protein RJ639_027516 [Escallonia herrerae]